MYHKTIPYLIIGAVLTLWACATAHQQLLDKPVIEFREVVFKDVSLFKATPVFIFDLKNTNPKGLSANKVSYDLKILDQKFVRGVSDQCVRIRPAGESVLELPISFNYLDLFDMMSELKTTKQIHYNLTGFIDIGPFSIPYQNEGFFNIPGLPDIRLKSVHISAMSQTNAHVTFNLEIINPHEFIIVPAAIGYTVSLSGTDMVSGTALDIPSVPAGGRADLTVSAKVNFAEGGESVRDILGRHDVTYGVAGYIGFDVPAREQMNFSYRMTGDVSISR